MKIKVKKKRAIKKGSTKKGFFKGGARNGALYAVAILAIVAAFGGVLTGGAIPEILHLNLPPPPADPYSCCDTGDGSMCHPIMEKQIFYNGDSYGLLKSKITQTEAMHIVITNSFTADGRRIFINTSDTTAHYTIPGCEHGKDLIGLHDPTKKFGGCFGVPNDELIYVCADTPEQCGITVNKGKVPFDVYFRIKDGEVPYQISTLCPKPKATTSETPQQVILYPTPSGTPNLQLETFRVQQQKTSYEWLGAWCKPADYFYPTKKTDISFDVKPQGEFTYTLPQYKPGGWNFTAFPDGNLVYKGQNYPYIYWDAAIPNNLITEPKTGYEVDYGDLSGFLQDLLPRLGLNRKETVEFTNYWIKELPNSKYYFVGIIPQKQIDAMAPLSISPTPDSILRVTLYFKPISEKTNISTPQAEPYNRSGFTVVEWGAIFDTQKHPGFSCLM